MFITTPFDLLDIQLLVETRSKKQRTYAFSLEARQKTKPSLSKKEAFGNNKLTTLPDEITQLKSLMGLGLQNNSFSSEEKNKIRELLDISPAF